MPFSPLSFCCLLCRTLYSVHSSPIFDRTAVVNELEPLNNDRSSGEQSLLWHLMHTYEKNVRPVFNHTDKVTVAVGLTLTHIFNIDEKSQVLSLNVWLGQQWIDQRIKWDPTNFNNLSSITVPKRFLWTPDIVLFNNAEDFSQGMVQTNAAIFQNGLIHWLPPVKFRSTCALNMQYFPFDRQKCSLMFRSWIYDANQIVITNMSENIDISNYNEHGEWDLIEIEQHLDVKYYNSDSQPFSVIIFTLHLQRRTLFYMYNILIPCVMLSLLTMMQFWLPCESGEKITLGLTVVLAYSVFNFNIAESMPETSDVIPLVGMKAGWAHKVNITLRNLKVIIKRQPKFGMFWMQAIKAKISVLGHRPNRCWILISITHATSKQVAVYIMCIMAISCMAVCFSVMVLKVRHGGERRQQVPGWLAYVANTILGPVFCFPAKDVKKAKLGNEQNASVNKAFHALSTYIVGVASNQAGTSAEVTKDPPDEPLGRTQSLHQRRRASTVPKNLFAGLQEAVQPSGSRDVGVKAFDDAVSTSRLRGIINRTAILMNRFEFENQREDTVAEWQRVSRIFDQFFFWVVFFLTFTCTMAMFVAGFAHQQHGKRLPPVLKLTETIEG